MRLKSFQIMNYGSIKDTGIVHMSPNDNILILAGQNESGKSTILRALHDFEQKIFSKDSISFSSEEVSNQVVVCTYEVEEKDSLTSLLSELLVEAKGIIVPENTIILEDQIIKKIKHFTITRKLSNEQLVTMIDETSFNILRSAVLNQPQGPLEKYLTLSDEENDLVASIFWKSAPKIVLFDDFCDLLPDNIFISKLDQEEAKGCRAVNNLEKILQTDFKKKDTETDPMRRTREDKENKQLTIDFQKDWGQKIHNENAVVIKYNFEKRDSKEGSYVNFFIETKEGQPLPPRLRSKGLIWFLSLWMELKAQAIENDKLILLLDEPDQYLHIKAQKDILKLITRLALEGAQVIFATHSPYMLEVEHLNRIKLVMNQENDGTIIEDVTTSKIDTESKRDALQPLAETLGARLLDMSPLGDKNVLLEGVSDFYYFSAMKKLLKRDGNYKFIPGTGVRKLNNLISLCIGYGFRWLAIIDDDPKTGGKDSKKKFDEIRDYVFDGHDGKAKEKIFICKNVIGIENMFEIEDLRLVDSSLRDVTDKVQSVGKNRKVIFAKMFFEKVQNGQISRTKLSEEAKARFAQVFDFIEKHLDHESLS